MAIRPNASKRIDAYIKHQRPFAQPILKKLRVVIRRADPKMVEDWKWGPNFAHAGMVCGFFGFKRWAALWFFNGAAIPDKHKLFNGTKNRQMRSINFTTVSDVQKHEQHLIAYIHQAVKNNLAGVKPAAPRRRTAKPLPADIKRALSRRGLARAYAARPPYQQRDYASWITAAKQVVTRDKRLEQMLDELDDGQRYMGMRYAPKR